MAFTLPRLPASGFSGSSAAQQQIWWQQVVEAIEAQENAQNDQIAAINALQASMASTIADLEETQRHLNIGLSTTAPTTILSSSDAGTNATITIAAHTRIYGDGTQLAIAGPVSITGLAYGTLYAVYYDDPTLADTTPGYVATTTLKDAQANFVEGRHFVGQVTTTTAGGATTAGDGPRAPSGGGPYP